MRARTFRTTRRSIMRTARIFVSCVAMLACMSSSVVHADDLLGAVKAGDVARVQAAISGGAHVNQSAFSVGTALHLAAATGNVKVAEALIAAGANLEAKGDPAGALPLHIAAQVNELEISKKLVY